ncbi:MAG: GtrA family protein [Lachnospiraceae bacterium]|nr:GtrA family protein [Lachnospiraceae bacterium]
MKNFKNTFFQFIEFGIVGVLNTAISLITYYICIHFGMHYLLANTMGFIFGTANAYLWNSKIVFKKKEEENRSVIKTGTKVFLVYGFSYLLSTLLLALWVDVFGIPEKAAPIINVFITTPLNFLMNKFWAFRD